MGVAGFFLSFPFPALCRHRAPATTRVMPGEGCRRRIPCLANLPEHPAHERVRRCNQCDLTGVEASKPRPPKGAAGAAAGAGAGAAGRRSSHALSLALGVGSPPPPRPRPRPRPTQAPPQDDLLVPQAPHSPRDSSQRAQRGRGFEPQGPREDQQGELGEAPGERDGVERAKGGMGRGAGPGRGKDERAGGFAALEELRVAADLGSSVGTGGREGNADRE